MPLSALRMRFQHKDGTRVHSHTMLWYLGKWDAPIYAAVVAICVPFMGWVSPGESRIKLIVLAAWFALTTFYWWIELMEIVTEIRRDGLLDIEKRNHQKLGMQLLYWGVAIAIVIWAILWALGKQGPSFGWIEWAVLVHTVLVARLTTISIYPMIDNYLQASAGQRRVEKEDTRA
jgi:hypothetical protein